MCQCGSCAGALQLEYNYASIDRVRSFVATVVEEAVKGRTWSSRSRCRRHMSPRKEREIAYPNFPQFQQADLGVELRTNIDGKISFVNGEGKDPGLNRGASRGSKEGNASLICGSPSISLQNQENSMKNPHQKQSRVVDDGEPDFRLQIREETRV